jgi:pentatricopeptide repeat protein
MLLAVKASAGTTTDDEKSLSRSSITPSLHTKGTQIFNESQVFHFLDELEKESHESSSKPGEPVAKFNNIDSNRDFRNLVESEYDENNVKIPNEFDLQEWFTDAEFHLRSGDEEEAELILQDCFDWREKILGPLHPDTIRTLAHLVDLLCEGGRFDEAYEVYLKLLEESERLVG